MAERMKSDFLVALTQLAAERNLPREIVLSAIEAALASAYRKDSVAAGHNLSVKLEPSTGEIEVHVLKTVVEEIEDEDQEILLADAQKIKADSAIGDNIATESIPHIAGRIAAQTAKQVVMQRLREAERELVYEEFADKEGEVFTVNIQRLEPKQLVVDLGRAEAILPISEQVPYERYRTGQKIKVLLQTVQRAGKGPELIVSRADILFLKRLFEMEVPEIYSGAVEIIAIAREPGSRSKVAVRARQDGVDPVGSCVGLRGIRIQNIVNELQGEKIDVVAWSRDMAKFIGNALSPSQVMRVELDDETESAIAVVPERQLSLAIGREGQNARLAARLTGWHVDIRSNVEATADAAKAAEAAAVMAEPTKVEIERLELSTRTVGRLKDAGVTNVGQLLDLSEADMLQIKGFGAKSYAEVSVRLKKLGLLRAKAIAKAPEPEVEVAAPTEEVALEPGVIADIEEAVSEAEAATAEPEAIETAEPATEEVAADVQVEAETPPELEPVTSEEGVETAPPSEESEPSVEAEETVDPGVLVAEQSASLRDVSDDIWSVRKAPAIEPGVIRFAEDIADLRGGVTSRRGNRGRSGPRGRGRPAKASKRRR